MATEQHKLEAKKLKELSKYNYDDWGSDDLALFDKWMFINGKWAYGRDKWIDYSRPTKAKFYMHMAAYLTSILARENNTPN